MQNTHARTHARTHTHTPTPSESQILTHSHSHTLAPLSCPLNALCSEKKKWALFPLFGLSSERQKNKKITLSFFLSFFTRVCAHSVEDELYVMFIKYVYYST